ncbi:hypothetical protein F5887DRAFT_1134740 [Amanita rubescens]|nr:hypothetical protein F5887DRAFT_1134740 [Amanita rubescens]
MAQAIDEIDERIQAMLKSCQPAIEAFLKNPELPTWAPPDHATPNVHEFITSLQIPSYSTRNPSLLFHDLEKCDEEEITKIFGADTHMLICNASGSGKTRRVMEGLTKYWGFYIVAASDTNGVGIRDIPDALELATRDRRWVSNLRGISPKERVAQNQVNSEIASRVFRSVLAARIVVFQFFLQLVIQVDGCLQEKHKRIWLLFQLSNRLNPHGGSWHPFIRIISELRCASDEALNILIDRLNNIITTYLQHSRPILALDDAHWAARLYPSSGISSTKPEVFLSIVCEMTKAFTKAPIKLVVSSNGLLLEDLDEAVGGVEVFHELGMFDTWPKLKSFFERYVPASVLETPSGYRLQQRMREYLLGRYRFSISFIECFLRNGLKSPHKLLNKYLEQYITCFPGDTGNPFTSDEPNLHIHVKLRGFNWDRIQLDSNAVQEAIKVVQSHLIKGKSPEHGPVSAKLVDYGIAFLRTDLMGHIVEPLAFLSLTTWLQTQCDTNLNANLRGLAFEDVVVLSNGAISSDV